MNVDQPYTPAQKALHWIIALLIIAIQIPVGILIAKVLGEGPLTNALYEVHKSFGLVIFALALVRIGVRLVRGAPPVVPGLAPWQRAAAHISHYALYALIVLVPLAGWAATSACCAPVKLFWTIPLTLPIGGGMEAAGPIFAVHNSLAILLTLIVLVHAGAALHHHFARRDPTLLRMLSRSR